MLYRLLAAPRESGIKYWELPILFDSLDFNKAGGSEAKLIDWIRLGYVRAAKKKERKAKRAFYTPTPKISRLPLRARKIIYHMEVMTVE